MAPPADPPRSPPAPRPAGPAMPLPAEPAPHPAGPAMPHPAGPKPRPGEPTPRGAESTRQPAVDTSPGDRPLPAPVAAVRPGSGRARIVLAEVTRPRSRYEQARAELTAQTRVGETLVRGLVRAQLTLALRLSLLVVIGLGGLPWLFAIAPAVARVRMFGAPLPWLLLGVAAFPFLVGVGWAYVRLAERNEQDFTDLLRRPER